MTSIILKKYCFLFIAIFIFLGNSTYSQNVFMYALNNLDFGDVYIGYSKTVNHTDAGSAKFRTYQNRRNSAFVVISFSLPSTLNNGSYTLPITFGSSTSAWSFNDLPYGRTNFDPRYSLAGTLSRNRNVYLWIGGNITVPTNVIPGTYSSTITATIVVY